MNYLHHFDYITVIIHVRLLYSIKSRPVSLKLGGDSLQFIMSRVVQTRSGRSYVPQTATCTLWPVNFKHNGSPSRDVQLVSKHL